MVLLISYDLVGRERPSAYADVKAYIEQHAISAKRPLYSQWFVETNATPDTWQKALADNNMIDANDHLFICEIRRPYQGWLPKDVWDWLSSRL